MVYKDVSQKGVCETWLEPARNEFEAGSGSKYP